VPQAPSTTAPSATGAALKPFRWLFGFNIQAGPTEPIVIGKDQGFFQQQGLDVSWDFTTDSTGLRLVGAGQYQAGSVSDVVTPVNFVTQGLPIKAIALITQAGQRGFAVMANSGITRPKDFEGKRVGIKVSPWTEYLAMLGYDKVDRSKIQEVPVGFSSVELPQNLVDVLPVFWTSDGYTLKNSLNADINILFPEKFGYPPIGTSIIVNTDFAKSDPNTVTAFLKGYLKATEFYLNNKEKAVQIAIEYAGPNTTRAQHEYLYDATVPQMTAGVAATKGVGYVTKEQWQSQLDLLASLNAIPSKPSVDDLLDMSFLDKVLKDGKLVWP
jgi:ABC-type nitrate/sulfonate/bicarbonate transport system substrate-binding protein